MFRRGTVYIRRRSNFAEDEESKEDENKKKQGDEFNIVELHEDLVGNEKFYLDNGLNDLL